jgi:hypothetical protein
MRRTFVIGAVVLFIAAAIAVGVGAYNAGYDHGLTHAGNGTQVVRVVGPGFGFPVGLILFPLVIFGIVALARGAAFRRYRRYGGPDGPWAGQGWHGPGHWKDGRGMAEEWHRTQHAHEGEPTSRSGTDPGGASSA